MEHTGGVSACVNHSSVSFDWHEFQMADTLLVKELRVGRSNNSQWR
jgi:hypothetical protein